jgi:hypothetical protein
MMSRFRPSVKGKINEGRMLIPVLGWRIASVLLTAAFLLLSLRWSLLDNSPPAWDQGLYMYQATQVHAAWLDGGLRGLVHAIFNIDRGRVPLVLLLVQPAFWFFGPVLDAAVITLNFGWLLLAWGLFGIVKEVSNGQDDAKAGFFALALFGLYPLTVMVAHSFLVELPLIAFVCASMRSILALSRTRSIGWSFASGVFVGLGLLTKVTFVVFVFPAVLLAAFWIGRHTTARAFIRLLVPGLATASLIAAPVYIYNLRHILSLTTFLSSKGLADLYGFGDVFSLSTIIDYWKSMFGSPVFAIVLVALLALAWRALIRKGSPTILMRRRFALLLSVWFLIPFVLATFGQIKDPRYLFPALMPLFIFAGLVAAQAGSRLLTWLLIALLMALPLPGFLYSNGYLLRNTLDRVAGVPGLGMVALADVPPDVRDWKVDGLVSSLARTLPPIQDNRKIIFLGGNRYHHLRLLDYQGLRKNIRFDYVTLPYYVDVTMGLDDAVNLIRLSHAAGVLFKTGENWPAFSSRLDLGIVERLRADADYVEQDLGVEQPDGSRFILFKNRSSFTAPTGSLLDLLGDWKVGDGTARIQAVSGGAVRIRAESGDEGLLVLKDGEAHVPQWNVHGQLSADATVIYWSNGSVWRRLSRY